MGSWDRRLDPVSPSGRAYPGKRPPPASLEEIDRQDPQPAKQNVAGKGCRQQCERPEKGKIKTKAIGHSKNDAASRRPCHSEAAKPTEGPDLEPDRWSWLPCGPAYRMRDLQRAEFAPHSAGP